MHICWLTSVSLRQSSWPILTRRSRMPLAERASSVWLKAIGGVAAGGFRLGVNPVSECFRLKDADGDEFAAACAAAGFAGDGVAGFLSKPPLRNGMIESSRA